MLLILRTACAYFSVCNIAFTYFISAKVSIFGPEEQSSDFGQTFVIRGSQRDVVYLGHGLIKHTENKAICRLLLKIDL